METKLKDSEIVAELIESVRHERNLESGNGTAAKVPAV